MGPSDSQNGSKNKSTEQPFFAYTTKPFFSRIKLASNQNPQKYVFPDHQERHDRRCTASLPMPLPSLTSS